MALILLIGEDETLLRTRAAVLQTTGAETVTASCASALAVLGGRLCDLVVICHSIPERVVADFVAVFHSRSPGTPILRMTSLRTWDTYPDDGVVEEVPSADPDRLVQRSAELIREFPPRSSSGPDPIHKT